MSWTVTCKDKKITEQKSAQAVASPSPSAATAQAVRLNTASFFIDGSLVHTIQSNELVLPDVAGSFDTVFTILDSAHAAYAPGGVCLHAGELHSRVLTAEQITAWDPFAKVCLLLCLEPFSLSLQLSLCSGFRLPPSPNPMHQMRAPNLALRAVMRGWF